MHQVHSIGQKLSLRAVETVIGESFNVVGARPYFHLVDLRLSRTVGHEHERATIARPGRLGINSRVIGYPNQLVAQQVLHIDVWTAVFRQHHRKLSAVGRPHW